MPRIISAKTKWVATDGWRGYSQPINAVCGCSDTGSYSDSPAPHATAMNELRMATKALREAGIKYRRQTDQSSNVFMVKHHILVAPEDRERAKELLEPLYRETRLLHPAGD